MCTLHEGIELAMEFIPNLVDGELVKKTLHFSSSRVAEDGFYARRRCLLDALTYLCLDFSNRQVRYEDLYATRTSERGERREA